MPVSVIYHSRRVYWKYSLLLLFPLYVAGSLFEKCIAKPRASISSTASNPFAEEENANQRLTQSSHEQSSSTNPFEDSTGSTSALDTSYPSYKNPFADYENSDNLKHSTPTHKKGKAPAPPSGGKFGRKGSATLPTGMSPIPTKKSESAPNSRKSTPSNTLEKKRKKNQTQQSEERPLYQGTPPSTPPEEKKTLIRPITPPLTPVEDKEKYSWEKFATLPARPKDKQAR